MRKYILGIAGLVLVSFGLTISSWTSANDRIITAKKNPEPKAAITADSVYNKLVTNLYDAAHLQAAGLSKNVFEKALTGFYNLKKAGQLSSKSILTIADFDQASSSKRLYIIDLDKKKLLVNSWVAHGQRSGGNEANYFSNANQSYASSIGFYVTGEIYTGKHGRSLKLDGVDNGFNNNARSRAIVVHGADYVSQGTINALGRLGRSQGCPAVAQELANTVINTIENKTVLFINKSDDHYASKYLDESLAATFASAAQAHNTTD